MLLSWRKENKYYNVLLQFNLFNGISVVCTWGNITNNRGNYKVIICDNEAEMEGVIENIKKRRKAKGYIMTKC